MPTSFNHFPLTAKVIHDVAVAAVKKCCLDVQAAAQAKCPVATGYLKSSVYTHTWEASTYGQGVTGGASGAFLLPDVGKPASDTEAFIGVGANYGIYVEFGTSKMAAQPYLTPAAEQVAPSFQQAFARIEEKLREAGAGLGAL